MSPGIIALGITYFIAATVVIFLCFLSLDLGLRESAKRQAQFALVMLGGLAFTLILARAGIWKGWVAGVAGFIVGASGLGALINAAIFSFCARRLEKST